MPSNNNLDFYYVDSNYVQFLQQAEIEKRGFSRVPNVNYGPNCKPKFLCGIVFNVNGIPYYVSVSSFQVQKPDNFIICGHNGAPVASLRFNYMFPVPQSLLTLRQISNEPDAAYRSLLAQERRYCIQKQADIQKKAQRTYKRVLLGKDIGLVQNSCDFQLLETKYHEWLATHI